MKTRNRALALAGTALGIGAGLVAERSVINRRRRNDPEAGEKFGTRRGERSRMLELPDGARLFVEEVGPVSAKRGAIFIHGSALRTDVWHYQMAGLGGHRLVMYDLRGHGLSAPKGKTDFSIETLTKDLCAVIEATGLKETVIVGHSIGGMIALELCKHRPELLGSSVKGIVVVGSTYGPAAETVLGGEMGIARLERITRRPFDFLGTHHERIERIRKIIRPSDAVFWAVALAAFGPKASPSQIDFTYDMLAETPIEVIFDLIKSYRHFDMMERLADVTVPVLVLGATHDRLTVLKASEYLAEHLPKSELHVFDRCGHMMMLERHREFNRIVTEFLNNTLGTPRRKGSSNAR